VVAICSPNIEQVPKDEMRLVQVNQEMYCNTMGEINLANFLAMHNSNSSSSDIPPKWKIFRPLLYQKQPILDYLMLSLKERCLYQRSLHSSLAEKLYSSATHKRAAENVASIGASSNRDTASKKARGM
jgi:hypothetical protein